MVVDSAKSPLNRAPVWGLERGDKQLLVLSNDGIRVKCRLAIAVDF
jgi:hypothetical protein